MICIDIGEIGCMSIPKCHWMVIVISLVKKLDFCIVLPVGVELCMPGQYRIFPPLAVIITARRHGMLAARRCRRSTGIAAKFILQGLAELIKILERVVHTGDCTAKLIPNTFYEFAVWRSWRLLHLGDFALLKEIKDYPNMVRCGVLLLVAVLFSEMLPGKWH